MKEYTFLALVVLCASCGGPSIDEKTVKADAERLAFLQCNNKENKQLLLALEESIPSLEKEIATTQDTALLREVTDKLAVLSAQKMEVTAKVQQLDDSLQKELNHLYATTYIDTANQNLLNSTLQAKVEHICK